MISAIVLAAGLSKRMGNQNKLLLPFHGKTIIENTLAQLIATGLEDIIVVTGFEADKVKNTIKHLPVKILYNQDYEKGMTTSIQKGIEFAKGEGFMICLADMISITTADYKLIISNFENNIKEDAQCICIPAHKNEKGNPIIFSAAYKEDILEHTEMEGCKAIVQNNNKHVRFIEMLTASILQDIDHPNDYEKLNNE